MKKQDSLTNKNELDEPLIVQIILDDYKEHQSNHYSSIWGKEIYSVAFNRLDETENKSKYNFKKNNRYIMVR